ncbi:hypothetical protein D5b_00135 [Faustovirus]|nr:hypothetical protein D5b_00135 [Faustovirus]AMN84776.1 hypothetical protein D6_00376 [Faustovirus]AMP44092.1 hypothetical protein PRJ_Dakar_00133 [Faustovirus]
MGNSAKKTQQPNATVKPAKAEMKANETTPIKSDFDRAVEIIVKEVQESVKDKKVNIGDIFTMLKNAVIAAEEMVKLDGEGKKQAVIKAVAIVAHEVDFGEHDAMIDNVLLYMVPAAIDVIVDAANGNFNFASAAASCASGCGKCIVC